MSDVNAVFDNYSYTDTNTRKEEWRIRKNKQRENAYGVIEKQMNNISKNMNCLTNYLRTQAKFPNHSPNNCLLIMTQMPNATHFRELGAWQNDGYRVRNLNKKIIILEPSDPYITDNGESKVYYNAKEVYDISVTNAPARQEVNFPESTILISLIKSCPVNITPVEKLENSNKYAEYDKDKNCIYVCKGKPTKETIQDLVGEIAKVNFESEDKGSNIKDFKSICITYMLCSKYKIDFPKEQFEKIDNKFSGMEIKEIKKEMFSIRDTFDEITSRMLVFIQKENKNKEQVR